jgi:hypothetical protein
LDVELDEAAALLDAANEQAFFHVEAWRIAVARARLRAKRGDAHGAAACAREALALLADNTPRLPRHPDVGLIKTDPETIREMQTLAGHSGS